LDFEAYSREHRHFLVPDLPPLLQQVARRGVIADLGCGDGSVLWALDRAGRLGTTAYAIDLSPDRVRAAEQAAEGVRGIVGDATSVPLEDGSVDGVVVSQVIEHLPDDGLLAPEIARLLRPGGWFYVGSVLRGPRAWWIYRADGKRWLDPTHVREYSSERELVVSLSHPQLTVDYVRTEPLRFPIVDLAARGLAFARLLRYERLDRIYVDHSWLGRARRATLRVPGYHLLEVAGTRLGAGR
jgi:SAM-dependent methyltransferase